MKKFHKKHSKGSSLVFVIIAVAFVGILGSILLNVTLINIETKGTDRDVKKNFYKTETVMDKLNITMENISADAMKEAYITLMENYTGDVMNTTDQAAIQNSFATNYINNILKAVTSDQTQLAIDVSNNNLRTLPNNEYDIEKIKTRFKTDMEAVGLDSMEDSIMKDGAATMELSFDGTKVDTSKYLLLKNIKVKYEEGTDVNNNDAGISTWITTDIKFSVPILRFEGGGTYPNFTEYSIIGDDEVSTESTTATVDGSLYAGYNGFNVDLTSNVLVKRKSANIITRGDVSVQQGSTLTLGEKENLVNVYARNYKTSKGVSGSTLLASLNVYATSYIMDDLSLDAPYSDVYFGGDNAAYYGYSFNKDNTTDSKTELDSQYSSAILINGKNSSLQMDSDMSRILLGGRAYISRASQDEGITGIDKKDILMGESLSIKYDQNYYLVAEEHMKEGYTNPMPWTTYESLPGNPGEKEVLSDDIVGRSTGIGKLLKSGTGQGVIPYVYSISTQSTSGKQVYFYYNFKSQSAADTFFNTYCDKDDIKKNIVNKGYLRFGGDSISGMGISISPQIALFASGNYMTFEDKNSLTTYEKTIDTGDDAMLKQQSIDYALTYKALQMELSTANKSQYESTYDGDGATADELTGFGMSQAQLEGNQIFDSIMTVDKNNGIHAFVKDGLASNRDELGFQLLTSDTYVKAVPVEVDGTYVWAFFVVKSNPSSTDTVSLDTILGGTSYTKDDGSTFSYDRTNHAAIVVANCSIKADTNMRGLVISDNKVILQRTISLTAEPSLLRSMFRQQRATEGSKLQKYRFITYFDAFSGFSAGEASGASDGTVDISRYITYSNWRKNADEASGS